MRLMTLSKPLTKENVIKAIEDFESYGRTLKSYHPSTGYDLLVDNVTYPPKAIFGLALGKLLGCDILSSQFSGGVDSECFKILTRLGFVIVPKAGPSAEQGLRLYKSYSRDELSSIYDPDMPFTNGSGKWGLSGIISNVPRKSDYILIVTLGSESGNTYNDYMTEDGCFFWKSQNKHTQECNVIRDLICSNPEQNTVLLFMRTKVNGKIEKYTFFGPLAFDNWNKNSNKPVEFQWRFMNWPLPTNIEETFNEYIKPALAPNYVKPKITTLSLIETTPPASKKRKAPSKKLPAKSLKTGEGRDIDWAKRESANRELGLLGELAVMKIEIESLKKQGRCDLALEVEHVALIDPTAGYDIRSYTPEGECKYIEVKTTKGPKSNRFYISKNEVNVSETLDEQFYIYRVFNLKESSAQAEFYSLKGNVKKNFDLVPCSYEAYIRL